MSWRILLDLRADLYLRRPFACAVKMQNAVLVAIASSVAIRAVDAKYSDWADATTSGSATDHPEPGHDQCTLSRPVPGRPAGGSRIFNGCRGISRRDRIRLRVRERPFRECARIDHRRDQRRTCRCMVRRNA